LAAADADGTAAVTAERARTWPFALALTVLFFACAWTTNHYWDEYYYLFSVSRHSPGALMALEPALADGIFPNGFFSGKLAFVVVLWGIVALVGGGPAGMLIARLLFAVMTLGIAVATWLLMRAFLGDRRLAAQTAALLLLSPLTVYFGFKLLTEVPALLTAVLAGWQYVCAVRAADPRARSRALTMAAIGFAAAMLFRLTSVLFAFGLIAAALMARPGGAARRRILIDGLVALGGAIALTAGVFLLTVDAPAARFGGLAQSVTGRTPGAIVVVYAVAVFVQLFGILAAAALLPMRRAPDVNVGPASVIAAIVWLAVAMLPYAITAQYVEPRFFYTGLPAFALLAAIGLNNLASRVAPLRKTTSAGAVVLTLVLLDRVFFAPLMPYEIRESDYGALVEDVDSLEPGATLVAPWLSDFCYLSSRYPGRPVALAMSETYGSGRVFDTPEFRRWIGEGRYAGSPAELEGMPAPHVYVGWQYSPTVEALDRYLRPLHFGYLDDPVRRARLLDHLTPSWIWKSEAYLLRPIASHGPYRAFRIVERNGS
jgi:hypothetical protein